MTDLTIRTDRPLLRARSRSVRYALVTIVAPVAERTRQRAPIDVAFVLDRSGSMGGEKIVLARDAVLQGIGMLGPTDRFAIVAYDTSVDVVMPLGLTTAVARRDADSRLQEIGPGEELTSRLVGLPAASSWRRHLRLATHSSAC